MPVLKVSVLDSVLTELTALFIVSVYLHLILIATRRCRNVTFLSRSRKKGSGRREVIVVRFRAFKDVESKKLSHGSEIYLLNCFLFGI